jgi:diacylglycerol kinase family enzyme
VSISDVLFSFGAMMDAAAKSDDVACVCLLNPAAASRGASSHREQLAELFAANGTDIHIVTPERGGFEAAARRAIDAGCKRIIAAGGDGTVHAAANMLAGTDVALAVLPMGTLNHFALDLGIPLALEDAVRTALTGEIRSVDVGDVNGQVFVNNSSIGLYPRIVREREQLQRKGDSKWLALIRASAAVFRRSKALRLRMRHDDQVMHTNSDFVFVGNNQYQLSGGRIAARPQLDAGVLWVWHGPHAGRFRAVFAAAAALLGKDPQSPLTFTTGELVLEPNRARLLVAMDGEAVEMNAPLTYRVRRNGLRVVVPAQKPG